MSLSYAPYARGTLCLEANASARSRDRLAIATIAMFGELDALRATLSAIAPVERKPSWTGNRARLRERASYCGGGRADHGDARAAVEILRGRHVGSSRRNAFVSSYGRASCTRSADAD